MNHSATAPRSAAAEAFDDALVFVWPAADRAAQGRSRHEERPLAASLAGWGGRTP